MKVFFTAADFSFLFATLYRTLFLKKNFFGIPITTLHDNLFYLSGSRYFVKIFTGHF